MEKGVVNKKVRRKLIKKFQRKRKRQKAAKERDKNLENEEAVKLQDPAYQQWMQWQSELEDFQRLAEERQRQEEEEAWMRRELIAQRQFRLEEKKRAADAAVDEAIRLQQEKELEELEAAKRKRREDIQRRAAEAAAVFERTMQRMEEYLENPHIEAPADLRRIVESKPGEKLCEFFERTNCCRFGLGCVFNHKRPLLSKIIVVRHFFSHPLLEQTWHREYAGGDSMLEMSEHDMRAVYDEFFEDVVSEMERFGEVINFRTLSNVQSHLMGHVFVEYAEERSALKAFIKLQGRYYASKRLNVEFSNLVTWRGAICGLSLMRKCPKGQTCNYFHVFRNPENKYNTTFEIAKSKPTSCRTTPNNNARSATPLLSWNDIDYMKEKARNWRWSESPELELNANNRTDKHKNKSKRESSESRSSSEDKNNYHASDRSKRFDNSSRSRNSQQSHKSAHSRSSRRHRRRSIERSRSRS